MQNNINNSSIDDFEHTRYDEIIMYFTGHNMRNSTIITNDVIDNYLDEIVLPSPLNIM